MTISMYLLAIVVNRVSKQILQLVMWINLVGIRCHQDIHSRQSSQRRASSRTLINNCIFSLSRAQITLKYFSKDHAVQEQRKPKQAELSRKAKRPRDHQSMPKKRILARKSPHLNQNSSKEQSTELLRQSSGKNTTQLGPIAHIETQAICLRGSSRRLLLQEFISQVQDPAMTFPTSEEADDAWFQRKHQTRNEIASAIAVKAISLATSSARIKR